MGTYDSIPPAGSEYWQDAVDTFGNFPAGSVVGEARVAQDTQVVYLWDGAAWNAAVGGGTGTVTNVSVVSAGDFSGSVANPGTTPAITINSNATAASTSNTLVRRDGFANFAAGTITATLNGNANNVTGVVAIANGGTGQSNQQAALNNITNQPGGSNGDVLTNSGGNALWAAPAGPTYAQINAAIGAPANVFLASNASSEVVGYGEWSLAETSKFSNVQLTYQPNNLAVATQAHVWNTNLDPLQDSPNDSFQLHSINVNLDSAATGFDLGTSGDAASLLTGGFNYQGNGSAYGRLRYASFYSALGNGTDPVSIGGMAAFSGGLTTNPNVTLDGNVSGFGWNVALDASTTTTSNFSLQLLSDFSQLPVDVYGYQGVVVQPTIDTIKNTSNFNGFVVGPTVTTFEGNAGFFGGIINPQITTLGTNGATMLSISPNITHLDHNSQGINVYAQSTDGTADFTFVNLSSNDIVTTGVVRGLAINLPTDLTHMAIDATGHCNLTAGFDLVSGQGQMYGHVIGGEIRVPNATAITGTDTLANNMAFTVNLGDATSTWTTSSVVGLTTLGFVGQIIGAGTASGAVNFCLNGFAAAHTGHIDRINNFMAAAIPTGAGGTVDEMVHYLATQPAGLLATDNWAFRAEESGLESYMPKLAIGDMTSKKVANASVGLEIDSTTKALLVSRMDSTAEGALTPINGMIIYNSTTNKFRGYENGAWVDLI